MGNIAANTARRKGKASSCGASVTTPPAGDARPAMAGSERYEQLIAFLNSNLPQPVTQQEFANGEIQFTGGDPGEVLVLLTDTSVVVSEFAGVWETPDVFVAAPRRIGLLKWRRLPENPLISALTAMIKGAREARRSQFQTCDHCGRQTAPEQLFDAHLCHSCATQHSGVVH